MLFRLLFVDSVFRDIARPVARPSGQRPAKAGAGSPRPYATWRQRSAECDIL